MKGSTYFVLAILLLMIVTILFSLQIPSFKAKLLPLVLSIAIAIFAIARLFVELREKVAEESSGKETKLVPTKAKPITATSAWFIGFFLMIYLVGFPLAIFLFVTAYFKLHHRGWIKSIALGLGMGVFIYVGFDFLLGVDLYEGVLYIPLYRFLP